MIKKLNILLVVVLCAMFAMKGLKEIKKSREQQTQVKEEVAARQEVSSLAPCAYYAYWAGYTVENPISNRNGMLLDIVKAIFPNATFRRLYGDVTEFAQHLREDPNAVVVGFGEHPDLKNAKAAPTPLMYCPIVLLTLRTNPWRYKDMSSLEGVRILANEAFLDYKVLRDLLAKYGKDSPYLRIMPASVSKEKQAEMVANGEADAFVSTGVNNSEVIMDGIASTRILQQFRKSDPIGNDGTFLYVSTKDASFATNVVAEYEAGLRRIDASGQLRRILEYYGMPYAPVGKK
jgi:hypothetical protein